MDTSVNKNSFSTYSKVEARQQSEASFRQNSRKRLIIISLSIVVLIAIIVGASVGILANDNKSKTNDPSSSPSSSVSSDIKAICNVTIYPDSCYSSMSSSIKSENPNPRPKDLFLLSLNITLNELKNLSSLPRKITQKYKNEINDPLLQSALHDCEILFMDAVDQVNESISTVQVSQGDFKIDDIRTWLSTAITDQETCVDGLKETGKHLSIADEVRFAMTNSTEFTSNSLAIASIVMRVLDDHLNGSIHRKLLKVSDGHDTWIHRRVVLEETPEPNITVAWDGSGDFKSIREAVESIPKRSESRFVLYVKEGLYLENVTIEKDHWNVVIYGDGMNKTVVSASNNVVDGATTFFSGTFIAAGRGFIAKDIGFKNTAGPQKHQAVALRSSSDKSIFYRCSFDAFQDTLYVHSGRQFYRDCQISGTIDFIFGNAAVVFQNCTIQPRQPFPAQFNTITAQSKSDPNQNTGMSIQRCQLNPLGNLTAVTYFGRPWKDYATTVIMQSDIGEFLDPLGWASWEANESSVYYAEFQNFGPGSMTEKRVEWAGVRPNITVEEAEKFAVENFIQGSQWLPQAEVVYDGTL
ncbi:pectinesterase 3-like [Mercurialis annua]|uniref:pectinesterase 3-like n=1 Tax=Mercurialis annua TaxID=3986 RepID=UPI00215E4D08|nr:pectinesterase 3-like [Mercurialis annua]